MAGRAHKLPLLIGPLFALNSTMNSSGQPAPLDILVVDDTTANLNLLTTLLEEVGYVVRAAPLPELALQSALTQPPGLILLDVRMPEMDGFEVCRRLKQDERTAGVPVIFISALQELSDRVQGFEAGGVDFITKPFQREEVLARVSAHLELKTLRNSLEARVEERTHELATANETLKSEIVERKAAVEALSISEERYRLAENAGQIGSWDWDIVANEIHWSDMIEPMLGFKSGELGSTFESYIDCIHPDDRSYVVDLATAAVEKSEDFKNVQYRIVWPDRSIHWISATGDVIRNAQGEGIRMLGIIRDITKLMESRKALELSREQLRSLVEHMHAVREEEQKRIARDIHDDLGQLLTTININISSIEDMLTEDQKDLLIKTEETSALVSTTIGKVQQIAAGLRPMLLDDLGIIAAIKWQMNGFQNRTGIRCSFESNFDEIAMNGKFATEVFRISQEALTNVARHAEATEVEISLNKDETKIVLMVSDNGRGATEDEINDSRSIGFIGIRERAHSLNGSVEISGKPGEGTSIRATFPTGDEQ